MFRLGSFKLSRIFLALLILSAEAKLFFSVLALAAADGRALGALGPGGKWGLAGGLWRGGGAVLTGKVPKLLKEGGPSGLGEFYRALGAPGGRGMFTGSREGPGERVFLVSPRVRRLQGRIIDYYLGRYFDIQASPEALEVLSAYPDGRQLGADLAAAAGLGRGPVLSAGDLALCRAVFPGFTALHRLRRGFETRTAPVKPPGEEEMDRRGRGKIRRLKRKGDRIPLLLSPEGRSARALMEKEVRELLFRQIRVKREIRRENIHLALYLEAAGRAARRAGEGEALAKVLSRIEDNHEKFSRMHKEERHGRMEQ